VHKPVTIEITPEEIDLTAQARVLVGYTRACGIEIPHEPHTDPEAVEDRLDDWLHRYADAVGHDPNTTQMAYRQTGDNMLQQSIEIDDHPFDRIVDRRSNWHNRLEGFIVENDGGLRHIPVRGWLAVEDGLVRGECLVSHYIDDERADEVCAAIGRLSEVVRREKT
jgi:hypothetical protein